MVRKIGKSWKMSNIVCPCGGTVYGKWVKRGAVHKMICSVCGEKRDIEWFNPEYVQSVRERKHHV